MTETAFGQHASTRTAGLQNRLRRLLHGAGDFFLPPLCVYCRTPTDQHGVLCASCWQQIDFIAPPLCDRLGIPLPYDTGGIMLSAAALANPPVYNRARAVARYDGILRELVHRLKYGDRHEGVAMFGRWLVQAGSDLLGDADLIVPVPLYRWRLWTRRFNQSAILARAMSRLSGIDWDALALVRPRPTRSQIGLSIRQRRKNVAGAFRVPRRSLAKVAGRNMLLVDDVITTGATAEACARALLRAGALRVDVLALARVTDPMAADV